jgi:integron integrase
MKGGYIMEQNPPNVAFYQNYLQSKQIVSEKKIPFYCHWVRAFYKTRGPMLSKAVSAEEIEQFLKKIGKTKEPWQVEQASDAIRLFLFCQDRRSNSKRPTPSNVNLAWKKVVAQMVKMIRLRQLSLRTEKTYLNWIRSFQRFLDDRSPYDINSDDVKKFLTYLAAERKVAAATQNQAFNALLFLYRYILDQDIDNLADVVRAPRRRRLPVVLTKPEICRLFDRLTGVNRLMAQIIYGGGLRLKECLKLRIKDMDFERGRVIVRFGKGGKDRETIFPESIQSHVKEHIESIRVFYDRDLKKNVSGVELPGALERKYPNAGKEWAWQWVFPSKKLSVDPRSGIVRRHHLHPTNLQRQIKCAVQKAKITKRVTVHTLRHYAESRPMPSS